MDEAEGWTGGARHLAAWRWGGRSEVEQAQRMNGRGKGGGEVKRMAARWRRCSGDGSWRRGLDGEDGWRAECKWEEGWGERVEVRLTR